MLEQLSQPHKRVSVCLSVCLSMCVCEREIKRYRAVAQLILSPLCTVAGGDKKATEKLITCDVC